MNFKSVIEELAEAGFWNVCIEGDSFTCVFNFEVFDVEFVSGGVSISGSGDCTELNINETSYIFYDDDFNTYTFQCDNEKISITIN